MKHLSAYLLCQLGGNATPSADDIKEVLDSVGIEPDGDRLEKLVSELEGKDIQQVIQRVRRPGQDIADTLPSLSLRDPPNSHPSQAAVLVLEELLPLEALPRVVLLLRRRLLLRRLRKRRRKSLTRTWASVFSTKRAGSFFGDSAGVMDASRRLEGRSAHSVARQCQWQCRC